MLVTAAAAVFADLALRKSQCRAAAPADPADLAREGYASPLIDSVLLELVVQRAFADPEQLCCTAAVSTHVLERVHDRFALELDQRLDLVGLRLRIVRGRFDPDMRRIDRLGTVS